MIQRLNYHLVNTPSLANVDSLCDPIIAPRRDSPVPFFTRGFLTAGAFNSAVQKQTMATQHWPWGWADKVRANNNRVVNQLPVQAKKGIQAKGRIPHADPIGEMIHIAAFERLFKEVKVEHSTVTYQPPNLLAAIPFVAATYLRDHPIDTPWASLVAPIFAWNRIYVVGWDGIPLDPLKEDHARRVFALLPDPETLGVTEMPPAMKAALIPARSTLDVPPPVPEAMGGPPETAPSTKPVDQDAPPSPPR